MLIIDNYPTVQVIFMYNLLTCVYIMEAKG